MSEWGTLPKASSRSKKLMWAVFFVFPGVFYHLLHCDVVLNCPVDARQKCLLHRGVNELVLHEEFGEPLVDEEVKGLADASTECNHSEVGRVGWVTFFVEKFHNRLTPGGRRTAH